MLREMNIKLHLNKFAFFLSLQFVLCVLQPAHSKMGRRRADSMSISPASLVHCDNALANYGVSTLQATDRRLNGCGKCIRNIIILCMWACEGEMAWAWRRDKNRHEVAQELCAANEPCLFLSLFITYSRTHVPTGLANSFAAFKLRPKNFAYICQNMPHTSVFTMAFFIEWRKTYLYGIMGRGIPRFDNLSGAWIGWRLVLSLLHITQSTLCMRRRRRWRFDFQAILCIYTGAIRLSLSHISHRWIHSALDIYRIQNTFDGKFIFQPALRCTASDISEWL